MYKRQVYETIVIKAKEANLAGATVLRGIMGFGMSGAAIHSAKLLDMNNKLPLVIEITDKEEKIDLFLPELDKVLKSGLVTLEKVQVIKYGK